MRVTNNMISSSLKRHIQNNLSKLSRIQEQMSTEKVILRPSDSPSDISRLMALKAQQEINKQYTQNIDDGLTYLYSGDTALGSAIDILTQASELAVQASNGTLDDSDMAAVGEQIDKMIDQMLQVANTTAGGKYIFAGTTNKMPPFERIPADPDSGTPEQIIFKGDMERISREIANLSEHTVDAPAVLDKNSSGIPGVFGYIDGAADPVNGVQVSSPGSLPGDEEDFGVFDTLFKLRDLLKEGKGDEVSDFIGAIQDQIDNVLQYRVGIGARTRHFEAVKDQMLDQEIMLSQAMDSIESADVARLSIDLSEQQLIYQTSLAAGANILQTSLLNFLK